MERIFDHTVTAETRARMTFLERYEGFCIDLIKVADISFTQNSYLA